MDQFIMDVNVKMSITNEELNEKGFFKVYEGGSSYITVIYYKPTSKCYCSFVARDYDYSGERDNDSLYFAPICESVRIEYLHELGIICEGDKIQVVKGRKVPKGTIATVKKIYPYKDKYGRIQAYYAYLDNGMKTNIDNCILL